MSNYINVLRRLERERRVPPAPTTPPVAHTAPATEPEVTVSNVVPVRIPALAPAMPVETHAPVVDTPAVQAPRTVIPLPSPPAVAPPATVQAPATAPPAAPVAYETPSARRFETARSRATASAHPGIAALLDNIRLLATGRSVRIVVFAGASTVEAVDSLAASLAEHANANGMKAIVGALTSTAGRTFINPVVGFAGGGSALEVELDTKVSPSALHDWLARSSPDSELLVICAPPLATSIDGALLACGCDGLVIVAESEVTERAALQTAAERARVTGCRTLGIVMHGAKDRIPSWIRKLAGTSDPYSAR